MNKKKIERFLFVGIFLNCCIVICITSVSLATENWTIVRPYRLLPATNINIEKNEDSSVLDTFNQNLPNSNNQNDYLFDIKDSSEEKQDFDTELFHNLHSTKDCKRYNGIIKLGLLNGIWLLNYGFGCKNRIEKATSNLNYCSCHEFLVLV